MGTLYIVATPIGNLGDITVRAREVLGLVAVVAAEDTRRTGRLLQALGIETKLESLHAHSEPRKLDRVVALLENGDMAYVTDAGTPGLSDPGAGLVAAARKAGHRVSPVPGPSALAAALSVSGMEAAGAVFLGFLPRRKQRRLKALQSASETGLPAVIYCSPRTVARTLEECRDYFADDAPVVVCRELTKLHEEIAESTLQNAAALEAVEKKKGEYLLVVGGGARPTREVSDARIADEMARERGAGRSARDAAAAVAARLGVPRRRAYDAGIERAQPRKARGRSKARS